MIDLIKVIYLYIINVCIYNLYVYYILYIYVCFIYIYIIGISRTRLPNDDVYQILLSDNVLLHNWWFCDECNDILDQFEVHNVDYLQDKDWEILDIGSVLFKEFISSNYFRSLYTLEKWKLKQHEFYWWVYNDAQSIADKKFKYI